ncbi:hypothetical protein GF358_01195 [Candidatus Woesearchaeota archaeon]|nr:hypothetical protein [Candidatus Woesearchaeota archaeon]
MSIFDQVKGLREVVDSSSISTILATEANSKCPDDKSGINENIFGTLREDPKLSSSPLRDKYLAQVADLYFRNGDV